MLSSDFNFFTNAADKDMLLDRLKASVEYISDDDGWRTRNRKEFCIDIDRTDSQVQFIVACLD